jgi:hypothetical protein
LDAFKCLLLTVERSLHLLQLLNHRSIVKLGSHLQSGLDLYLPLYDDCLGRQEGSGQQPAYLVGAPIGEIDRQVGPCDRVSGEPELHVFTQEFQRI